MFYRLGKIVSRRWHISLCAWLVAVVLATGVTKGWLNELGFLPHVPVWEDVVEDGEFAFLPPDMPSLQAEKLFAQSFPEDLLASSVVVVVRHESQHLDERDKTFIQDVLAAKLREMQEEPNSIISQVRTFRDPQIGRLLESEDKKASLVIVDLSTEFLEHGNQPTIDRIEKLIAWLSNPANRDRDSRVPPGVHLALSGSATVGRDMNVAAEDSAKNTEFWTILLVIGLLLIIYRAPLLALIPLFTVFVAVEISIALIILLSSIPWLGFQPFEGLKTYITVVAYGAGVDYCLFFIARYKEELDQGCDLAEGVSTTLERVGAALTASAATVACGIGMMVFAQFGKFRQAGVGMSLSLMIMLLAALTFTPAMLRFAGNSAFWPQRRDSHASKNSGWISATTFLARWLDRYSINKLWEIIGEGLIRRPGRIWLTCIALMLPFALIGIRLHGYLSYGLLSELPKHNQSVIGAKAVQEHFPAGNTGVLTVLIRNPEVDFRSPQGRQALEELTLALAGQKEKLGIADVRSVSHPWGLTQPPNFLQRGLALRYYVSQVDELQGQVTRIDVVFEKDPFSRDSIQQLDEVEKVMPTLLPKEISGSSLSYVGITASMRDLKHVTDQDQFFVDALVLMVVFIILWVLLRKPAISAYLIVTVFFSYFVALGVTFSVFWWLDPAGFSGLDWKVPMFLFTILIAVGEDYNIFLMSRIEEEQQLLGGVEGVRVALLQTGSIISSCGIIMAGTFFSLVLAGSLVGMQQLGFALAFGVLLDTFVVRPILVPAYLIMLYSGRFGVLGKFLGSHRIPNLAEQTHNSAKMN